jgi:nucleoside-diphosphate-sugar epimerase
MGKEPGAILLTGYPSTLIGRRLLEKILDEAGVTPIICAVAAPLMANARRLLTNFSPEKRQRIELCPYDVSAMDFGLSGHDFYELAERVQVIHHCAATVRSGLDDASAERNNLRSTGEVLELAKAARSLDRLVFWSNALCSGARQGVVLENELLRPDRFDNAAQGAMYRAEKLLREVIGELPVTILRPSLLVGGAKHDEAEPFEELHLLIQFIFNAPPDVPILLPKRGETPLHVVPASFVIDAGWAISNDPRSLGRAFHLVDPRPLKVVELVELIAKSAGKPCEVGELPTALTAVLLRTPGLSRWLELPRSLLERLAHDVTYDATNADEILRPSGLRCPPLPSYLDTVLEQARRPR